MDPKYQVGDIWEYKTRTGEEGSKFTVVKVEKASSLGLIIHIAVDNLTWRTCQGGPLPEQVPHMPFIRRAIDVSATRRIGISHSLPKYEEGYAEWRVGFLRGHAGVYTIPIGQAVAVAEETWRTGMGCGHTAQ